MSRCAFYCRFSTDLQRSESIDDQVRVCQALADNAGLTLVRIFEDRAMSGSSSFRPGYQAMLEAARRREFDVLVAEALDRISRDQEDIAALFKTLKFAGIRIITRAEGEVNELHVGLKGTMNAMARQSA